MNVLDGNEIVPLKSKFSFFRNFNSLLDISFSNILLNIDSKEIER